MSCGKFTIIGKTNRCNKKGSYIYCLCEFEDGAIVESDFTNISKGNIKSPNYPNVYGVGFMGQGKWKSKENGKTTKEYATWLHMMARCYSMEYPSYVGVTVCERWHCFQNFCEDIQKLQGYDKWKNDNYELDKDFLCNKLGIKKKIYSPKTCMFIPRKDNTSEATTRRNLTGQTYIGIAPDGTIFEFYDKRKFSKEHKDISYSSIKRSIAENRTIKGWTFKIKED